MIARAIARDTLVCLLAGGQGERLYPLTRDRAKPAVPFGGIYRIIDITLSNCINSELRRIYVLTQYKALSLNRHMREAWAILAHELGEFVQILPPMKRVGHTWYQGTADAIYQNLYSIGSERCKYVLILSGDHVYKMNYQLMLRQHTEAGADVTLDPADRLEAIRERTDGLRPPEELTDRVMDAVRASGPVSTRAPSSARMSKRTAFADGLARSGIRAMALAAAVAAACIIYSTIAERALDTHLVSTMDPVEGTD